MPLLEVEDLSLARAARAFDEAGRLLELADVQAEVTLVAGPSRTVVASIVRTHPLEAVLLRWGWRSDSYTQTPATIEINGAGLGPAVSHQIGASLAEPQPVGFRLREGLQSIQIVAVNLDLVAVHVVAARIVVGFYGR